MLGYKYHGKYGEWICCVRRIPTPLAETRSEFENTVVNTLIQEDGLNEKKFDIFPNLVMKCTENQKRHFDYERLQ